MPELDPAIERLELSPVAKTAAYKLKAAHPEVVFTSGRRNRAEQAHAMATNVVKNRKWIGATYKLSPASQACQRWVNAHPEAQSVNLITVGLSKVLLAFDDAELRKLSKHLSGDAFDVQPVLGLRGEEIKKTIRALPGLTKFLSSEGGLLRFHAQF